MVALAKWLTSASGTKYSLTLQVNPWVLDDRLRTMQLQMLLSVTLSANQVVPSGLAEDPPHSMRVYRGQEDVLQHGFEWVDQDVLNRMFIEVIAPRYAIVRRATADMVVQVVGTSPNPFTSLVCEIIQKYVGSEVAPNVYLVTQPAVYTGRVIELLVPQLDLPATEGGIPYDEFANNLRKLLDFTPYLS